MLKVKAKFADGQYMAARVSKAIQRETQKLSKLLVQYNSLSGPDHEEITWNQVTDLSSSLWSDNQIEPYNLNDLEVPRHIRLAAINALQKKNRAIEEKELIKQEMLNTINCYIEIYQALIQRRLPNPQTCTQFELGCNFLLHKKVEFYKGELETTMEAFKHYIEIPSFDHDITVDGQETTGTTDVNLSPSSFIAPASLVEKRAGMFTTSITSSNLQLSTSSSGHISISDCDISGKDMPAETEHYTETDLDVNEDLEDYDSDSFIDAFPSDQWGQLLDDCDDNDIDDSLQTMASNIDERSQHSRKSASFNEWASASSDDHEPMLNVDSVQSHMENEWTSTSSNDDSSGDEAMLQLQAEFVKRRLEKEEFLQRQEQPDLSNIISSMTPSCSIKRPQIDHTAKAGIKKRTLYVHRSHEQLDSMLESLKKDNIEIARREKIANIYAKEPFFKIISKK